MTWRDPEPYDAVVGRLILFHLPDPVATLRHHLEAVRPGGRVVVLDFDVAAVRTEPPEPLTPRLTALVLAAFRVAGADPTIGTRLQGLLAEAGVADVDGLGVAQYLEADPAGPPMLAGVVRSLAPVMLARGLATEAELDLDTLEDRLGEAVRSRGASILPPLLVGAWGRRP